MRFARLLNRLFGRDPDGEDATDTAYQDTYEKMVGQIRAAPDIERERVDRVTEQQRAIREALQTGNKVGDRLRGLE